MHEVGACWVQPLRPSLIAGHEGSRHHRIRPSLHRKHMHSLNDEQAVERGQTQDFNCREVPFVLFKYLQRNDVIRAGAGLCLFHWVFQFRFPKFANCSLDILQTKRVWLLEAYGLTWNINYVLKFDTRS